MSHTVACGRSKKKRCVCTCGGKLHGELVNKEESLSPGRFYSYRGKSND